VTAAYIVDAHHHLWDLNAVDYPWLRQNGERRFFGDPAPIQKDYLPADFRRDHGPLTVAKSVHIQVGARSGSEVDETRWLDEQAAQSGLPSAIIAFCDLAAPDAAATIERHVAASGRVRGIRQIVSRHADEDARDGSPELLTSPPFASGLGHVAARGLIFELQLTPPHMIAAAKLLERFEGLKVALCHAGSPWQRDTFGFAQWTEGLSVLAENPRVVCKLSGLGMFDPHWTRGSLKPIVANVLERFGPQRVMWGSNFPVDKLYRDYVETFSAIESLVPHDQRDWVFRRTAEQFYGI
jgi:predicted TIM-barrel fold metal-dependent hydrolase